MHHKRVGQEKNRLLTETKELKQKCAEYKAQYEEEKRKSDAARKEKNLLQMNNDNLSRKVIDQ